MMMTERERRQRVIDHLRAGEAQYAANELAGSRESYPGDGLLHHAIGLAFASRGTLERAREQLEAAVRLSPESAVIHADLGQVLLAAGQAEEALQSAEQSLELEPDLAIGHFTVGRACLAVECARQSKNPSYFEPGFPFPLIDGRTPLYLRAVRELEAALLEAPPFVGIIHTALAFAYARAGHFHAAAQQLEQHLAELPAGEESDRVADRLRYIEYEIAREQYWAKASEGVPTDLPEIAARQPESLLYEAHAEAVRGSEVRLTFALKAAKSAGYDPRPGIVTRSDGREEFSLQICDVHLLIAGGLECVVEDQLRFLPFKQITSIGFGPIEPWRAAKVELTTGESLDVAVPSLYRLSLRSPNDLIQSGRFTQFKYAPGETRHARAVGSRNFATDQGLVPFTEVQSIVFT